LNQESNQHRLGIAAALGAFTIWGLVPVYFKWIAAVPPLEIIVHRILWSIPMLAGFLLLRDGPGFWRRLRLPPRTVAILSLSGTLIVGNWLLFVWAINNDQILATSLGYFITPLFNVLLGIIFLHERLTAIQIAAVAIATAGTVFLAWFLGVAPWISLSLAASVGFYVLLRKKLGVGPMVGLLWETLLLAAPAVVYLFWATGHGVLVFAHSSLRLDLLLVLSGLITVLPLVWFNVAARHLALSTVGFFQYISPTTTSLLAVFVYHEAFTQGHAVAFTCIWLGLALVSSESFVRSRRVNSI
jgi:chloramphenicol-sensitive protein RarD